MTYSTFVVFSDGSHWTVDLYTGAEHRCHQPYSTDGSPWKDEAHAKAWVLERIQQGIDHENWPPLDPALAPPAPVDPPVDPPADP